MNNKKRIFEPIGKYEVIRDSFSELNSVVSRLKLCGVDIDMENSSNEIVKQENECYNRYKEILEYIRQFYGKYVQMKFCYKGANISDSDTETWICEFEFSALLYQYIPSNNCLFGVYCNLNNDYIGGVKDCSINLLHLMENHRLEIEEITEEEFIFDANATSYKCLMKRLDKIKSGNYELTENGYTRTSL